MKSINFMFVAGKFVTGKAEHKNRKHDHSLPVIENI